MPHSLTIDIPEPVHHTLEKWAARRRDHPRGPGDGVGRSPGHRAGKRSPDALAGAIDSDVADVADAVMITSATLSPKIIETTSHDELVCRHVGMGRMAPAAGTLSCPGGGPPLRASRLRPIAELGSEWPSTGFMIIGTSSTATFARGESDAAHQFGGPTHELAVSDHLRFHRRYTTRPRSRAEAASARNNHL